MKTPKTLDKLPDEERTYAFDYTLQPEIVNGATIVSAALTQKLDGVVVADLSIGTPDLTEGGFVKAVYADGFAGKKYLIECEATLNTGAVIGGLGFMNVVDPEAL